MRRPLTVRRAATAVLVAAVLFTGCSDDKGGDSAATPTTGASQAGTPRTVTGGPFCEFALTFNDRFGRITPDSTNPQRLRTTFEEATKAIEDAESSAPAEIKGDVHTLAVTFRDLFAILQQANFDFTKVTPAQIQRLQGPEAQAASQHLESYIAQNCKAG